VEWRWRGSQAKRTWDGKDQKKRMGGGSRSEAAGGQSRTIVKRKRGRERRATAGKGWDIN